MNLFLIALWIVNQLDNKTMELISENTSQPKTFHTCFQTSWGFDERINLGSDLAIVYGTNTTLPERIEKWRKEGYRVAYMTGISWGNYEKYYMTENGLKEDEIQTNKHGKLFMHGNSKTVGYNVPTPSYLEFIKHDIVKPAIECKVECLFLEEPEFWAETGWSKSFQQIWEIHYGEKWLPPDTNIETQFKASLLKYDLYTKALIEVFKFAKEYSKQKGIHLSCYVPTHSLVNYAQWRIVSPESRITQMDVCDGVIAQVWTGTARTPHHYKGVLKERTFETAYLEYAQMVGMVIPSGKQLIFLADPIEDNPNYDWNDYRENYESVLTASLLFPEVSTFEVMPWPERIFTREYAKSKEDKENKVLIPKDYATELLTVITALNDMNQPDIEWVSRNYPIGVVVSDTLMFQRAKPYPSDVHLNNFFGITTPLIKNGIPIKLVQMEQIMNENVLSPLKLLILSYEGQKPLKMEYHESIKKWVVNGGSLLIVDDNTDPYNDLNLWWKECGYLSPTTHLFQYITNNQPIYDTVIEVGSGKVSWKKINPSRLSKMREGDILLFRWIDELANNFSIIPNNYFHLRRGYYEICAVMDESVNDTSYTVEGKFINLFDPSLKVQTQIKLNPSQRALLMNLITAKNSIKPPKVILSSGRVSEKVIDNDTYKVTIRGPKDVPCKFITYLVSKPRKVVCIENLPFTEFWDNENTLLIVEFMHIGKDVHFEIEL